MCPIERAGGAINAAQILWDSAERAGDRIAIRERDRSVRYAELRDRAAAIALRLQDAGLSRGDRVVVFLDRGVDAAAAYFAVWAAGAVAVMVNDTVRARQLEYIISHSGARILLTSGECLGRLHRPLEVSVMAVDTAEIPSAASFAPELMSPETPSQITYTSGSTGLPKGVVASHGNVVAAISTVVNYLGLREEDRIASILPFSSVYGANQLLCALYVGAELYIEHSPVANQIAAGLREAEVTVLAGVPALWMQLLNAPEFRDRPIPSLRILQNAGGHLPPAAGRHLREAQPQAGIVLQYGMTEVFRSTFLPPDEFDQRPGSIGRPMPGTEILVLREDHSECAPGEVGELVHCGPTVTLGYWNDPERTREVFRPHPLRSEADRVVFSGDMVKWDEDGYLHYVGRRDRMIKSLGFRVGPDEILDVLHASGEIIDGVVTAVPDARRGEAIVAFVVLREGGDLRTLTQFARVELPRYMHPARYEVRDELPRMPNGKHDVMALQREAASPSAVDARMSTLKTTVPVP